MCTFVLELGDLVRRCRARQVDCWSGIAQRLLFIFLFLVFLVVLWSVKHIQGGERLIEEFGERQAERREEERRGEARRVEGDVWDTLLIQVRRLSINLMLMIKRVLYMGKSKDQPNKKLHMAK